MANNKYREVDDTKTSLRTKDEAILIDIDKLTTAPKSAFKPEVFDELRIYDCVEKPMHYAAGKIECINAMEEALGSEIVAHFCLGNAFKYIWRHKNKNGLEDIRKAQWYLNKYIELNADSEED